MCLLPAVVAPAASPGAAPPSYTSASRPYLAVLGVTPLRVADAVPPPDLSSRPGRAAPPKPGAEEAADVTPAIAKQEPTAPAVPDLALAPASEPVRAPAETTPAAPKTPPPILVDDVRPRVKPEDFLPFFIFPGSGGQGDPNVTVPMALPTPPTPGTLPPSSATYRQQ
jgi:hypothetical protein